MVFKQGLLSDLSTSSQPSSIVNHCQLSIHAMISFVTSRSLARCRIQTEPVLALVGHNTLWSFRSFIDLSQ
jgi:hypothetical protein